MRSSFFKITLFTFLLFPFFLKGQIGSHFKDWEFIGPSDMPINTNFSATAGLGPIEFIRASSQKKGWLLAGSLSGGLFYSENGGDSWSNTGSDNWNYSGCGWADFHPEDENVWFAYTHVSGQNGSPGRIGNYGGILRSKNKGKTWERIADLKTFGGTTNLRVYGTRFVPNKPKVMFVLTSEGLFYTEDCLSTFIKWNRVPDLKGWIYDLDFVGNTCYATNFFHGKWSVLKFDQSEIPTSYNKVTKIHKESELIKHLTIEPQGENILILKDYLTKSDELVLFNPKKDSIRKILEKQKVAFGSGHTFAVSPFDSNTFYLGFGTRVHKWSPPYKKKSSVRSGYHVDVEFITFDPFDSLTIYLATHGGVFRSNDGAITWESKNKNLGVSEVMGMGVSKTDPNQIAIGCFHDGSMVRTNSENDSSLYEWKTINGGDGLLALIHPEDKNKVYTSNQYVGGGLFYSKDVRENKKLNVHTSNGLTSSGWQMSTVLDHTNPNTVYFNFIQQNGINKGNINICRTSNVEERRTAEVISDFHLSHQLRKYKVYGLYNSVSRTNTLIAYVLEYVKDEKGNEHTNHRLFRTDELDKSPEEIKMSWFELEHPNNSWISDVEIDGYDLNKIYLSYLNGKKSPDSIFGDRGMVYSLRYKYQKRSKLKQEIDISKNILISVSGRYNMFYLKKNGGMLFVATRTGVYLGTRRTLLGKNRWTKIGKKLPHCKVYGLDFNEEAKTLTVGLFGRGVWQYKW